MILPCFVQNCKTIWQKEWILSKKRFVRFELKIIFRGYHILLQFLAFGINVTQILISRFQLHTVCSASCVLTYIFSMVQCKTAVSPLLMHWRYCSLALSHQFHICVRMPFFVCRRRNTFVNTFICPLVPMWKWWFFISVNYNYKS